MAAKRTVRRPEGVRSGAAQRVKQELRVEADRQASQARFQKFVDRRDEAQFLGTLYTGMDLAANLDAARTAVQQASPSTTYWRVREARPKLDAYLNDSQKAEILADCYQLLLILAETEAQSAIDRKPPEKDQYLRKALNILEQARQIGTPSRAFHLRRARYLNMLGDRLGASQAEKEARALPLTKCSITS